MFVQVFQGRTSDPEGVRAQLDKWERELAAGASGWEGITAGVTDDGELISVVRFTDEAAARRNSDRPEQGAWWSETESLFDGEVTFHDYPHTRLLMGGGSDDAGFVQIMQGTYTGGGDPTEELGDEEDLAGRRSDIIGGTYAWDDEGHFTAVIYFTSEEAARTGEAEMGSDPEAAQQMQRWREKVQGLRFLDLSDPWLESP